MDKKQNSIFWKVDDLPGEEWKPVEGFPFYSQSNKGRVKREAYERFYEKDKSVRFYPEMLMKQQEYNGYMLVTLVHFDKRKELRVNRLVGKAFIPNPNPEKFTIINHKNEDKTDNRVSNLEWGTAKYNANYGTRNERISRKNKSRTFTEEHRKNLSKAMKGNKNRLGMKNSQQQIEATKKAKSKAVVTKDKQFTSIKDAADYYDVRYETFARWLRGGRKMPDKYQELGLRYEDKS